MRTPFIESGGYMLFSRQAPFICGKRKKPVISRGHAFKPAPQLRLEERSTRNENAQEFHLPRRNERFPIHMSETFVNFPAKWQKHRDPFDSNALKRRARMVCDSGGPFVLTPGAQLEAILSSRAWRWVCRYGRFKNRYLAPTYEFLGDLFGHKRAARQANKKNPTTTLSSNRTTQQGL
jgi:hypothetical protein